MFTQNFKSVNGFSCLDSKRSQTKERVFVQEITGRSETINSGKKAKVKGCIRWYELYFSATFVHKKIIG